MRLNASLTAQHKLSFHRITNAKKGKKLFVSVTVFGRMSAMCYQTSTKEIGYSKVDLRATCGQESNSKKPRAFASGCCGFTSFNKCGCCADFCMPAIICMLLERAHRAQQSLQTNSLYNKKQKTM